MAEYMIVYPWNKSRIVTEIQNLSSGNNQAVQFDELEKRLGKHPLIKLFDLIPNGDHKTAEFYRKELGCSVYRLVDGKVLPL